MTTPLGQVTGELQDVREYSGGAGSAITGVQKYTGNYCVQISVNVLPVQIAFPAQTGGLRAGAWFRPGVLSVYGANVCRFYAGATVTAMVMWNPYVSNLELHVSSLRAQISINALPNNVWSHIGMTYIPAIPVTTFYINGLPVMTYSGSLQDGCDSVGFGGTSGVAGGWDSCWVDDAYVDGAIFVDEAPPPARFLFSLASAAGASAQWTPAGAATNVQCVDDGVPNDDTDYVKAESADLVDLYDTANITLPTDYGIVSAIPIVLAKRMASGPTVKLVAADGVSANLESAEKTPGTSYSYHWESMPLAPDGGDWTEAKVNAAQFGVKSTGVYA